MERRSWQPRFVRDDERPLVRVHAGAARDVGITSMLLLVSLIPIAGELGRVGRWSASSVGLATATAILAVRELWHELLDARRGG